MAQFCQPTCVGGWGGIHRESRQGELDGVVGQLHGSEKRNFSLGDNPTEFRNASRSIDRLVAWKVIFEKPKNRVSHKQLAMSFKEPKH
jgi:hypothetical protein